MLKLLFFTKYTYLGSEPKKNVFFQLTPLRELMLYDYLVIIQKSSQVPNVSFMSVPLLTTGLDFVTKYSSSVL